MSQFDSTDLLDTPRKLFKLLVAEKIFQKWNAPSFYIFNDKVL